MLGLATIRKQFRALFATEQHAQDNYQSILIEINKRRSELERLSDEELDAAEWDGTVVSAFALASEVARRVLGLRLFDEQLLGALALQEGKIAEMQTGEGKTLAAVPAVFSAVCEGSKVHVLTANDYLAERDAGWMGGVYRRLDLSVGFLKEGMEPSARRAAYACDVLYATANEVGFDYLRDQLCLRAADLVQAPFDCAIIDEADSILLDEARIPLVIAGGQIDAEPIAYRANQVASRLRQYTHFYTDEHQRNIRLTDRGAAAVEAVLGCGSLYDECNYPILNAIHNALHARVLLRRDVDYVVRAGAIELVDEFKGRVATERRWPADLQTALEAKEGLAPNRQGRVLGSITLQNLISMYPKIAGMTGTAHTQAEEFAKVYGLPVCIVPTHKPVIRLDYRDAVFATRSDKETALVNEIAKVHASGRPILVGTASVAESDGLSGRLFAAGIQHRVLNARDNSSEAEIIAQAGALGAVTVSTNMAGRGTDILLGGNPQRDYDRVCELGGLYVIGTNKHESRRIDNQLRGRAGRQGDPGSSRFFVSFKDDLMQRFGIEDMLKHHSEPAEAINAVQRIVEGQTLEIRRTLWKYEGLVEQQRSEFHAWRRELLMAGRTDVLPKMDELWADHLEEIREAREGAPWQSWSGKDPLHIFLREATDLFAALKDRIRQDLEESAADKAQEFERGATWTYMINDQPFGTLEQRMAAGLRRKIRAVLRS
jgi:preprotein translocase subunit SecA